MEEIFGLPAHPLFIHAPVVLMPLLLLGVLALAVRPQWRRRFSLGLLLATVIVLVATLLAVSSGQAFKDANDIFDDAFVGDHESLAETTRLFAFLLTGAVLAVAALDLVERRGNAPDQTASATPAWVQPASIALTAVMTILAVLATVWMIRTGHEGARITWNP